MFKRKQRTQVGVQIKQSVPYKNDEEIRTSPFVTDDLLDAIFDDAKTMHEIFMRGVRVSGDKPCVGWRLGPDLPYTWITYNDVLYRSKCVGSGLISLGAKPNPSQLIGIITTNRLEWILAEQACNCYSMVIVPFIETRGSETIMDICKLKFVIVNTNANARSLMTLKTDLKFPLDCVVIMDEINEDTRKLAENCQITLIKFSDLEELGMKKIHELVPPQPNDLYKVEFTSGTTGSPKGVMLMHKNLAIVISTLHAMTKYTNFNFDESDVYLSFAPVFSTSRITLIYVMFLVGGKVGFFGGNRINLLYDARELKPTVFSFPVEMLYKLYRTFSSTTSKSFWRKFLLNCAFKAKLKLLHRGIVTTNTIWDYLVFYKIRKLFGGKVKVYFAGGAPILKDAIAFMRCALGAKLLVGYNMVETSNLLAGTQFTDAIPGSVGSPAPCLIIKLADVAKLNYFVKNRIGEICVKGPNLFPGYYKDETLTKAVFDNDGWFHTGDVGTWLDDGCLVLIDRLDNIFVLSSGEQIAPLLVEAVLCGIEIIKQIFTYGDSQHDFVVAIVVPDEAVFSSWCTKKKIDGDYKTFFENQKVNSLILDEINRFGKEKGLKPYEIPKKIFISEEEFSTENGLFTVSFKNRRFKLQYHFQKEIKDMLDL